MKSQAHNLIVSIKEFNEICKNKKQQLLIIIIREENYHFLIPGLLGPSLCSQHFLAVQIFPSA